jgi:competence protein ComEC
LAGLATSLPEPHDQFAAGLLVGQKSELAGDVAEKLRIVGLSHIIAVSGYNLTIMADVARKRLGKRSRFQSTFFSIVFVALFVALAGTSASIARAAFVSVLTIVAAHYGRQIKPVLLILLAAGFTAWTNPLNIWSDIGWHLSFLAFFGVLVVAPAIQGRLYVGDKKPLMASKVVIETTSAQIMTVPISLYIFGQVSLISLLANIAVVPLVPLAMLFSLLAGVAGMIMPALAGIVAWPARVLLDFILSVTSLLSRVPHALEKMSINLATLIVAYCLVVVIVAALRHKTSQSVTITE